MVFSVRRRTVNFGACSGLISHRLYIETRGIALRLDIYAKAPPESRSE
jgi:hypothetical protein